MNLAGVSSFASMCVTVLGEIFRHRSHRKSKITLSQISIIDFP
jgi:hypothetical protein